MEVRNYEEEDAEEVADVHRRSVREICASDYSEEEIDAWSEDTSKEPHLDQDRFRFVATQDGDIIGFADYDAGNNEVTGLYVHPEYTGIGVGQALLTRLEEHAINHGVSYLEAKSTITAHDFYVDNGFTTVRQTKYDIKGYDVTVYLVRKSLL